MAGEKINDAELWRRAMSSPARDLETIAERLDFFDLKELPEYTQALEALRKYGDSALVRIDDYYKMKQKLEDNRKRNGRVLEEQMQYVLDNAEEIYDKYGDDYLAVRNRQVIDNDEKGFRLAKRVLEKYPHEVIFIERLKDILWPRTDFLESPECEDEGE